MTTPSDKASRNAFDKWFPNDSQFYTQEGDAWEGWQACNAWRNSLIPAALENAALILANFKSEKDRVKIEEWEACYASLFTQMNELCNTLKARDVRITELEAPIAIDEIVLAACDAKPIDVPQDKEGYFAWLRAEAPVDEAETVEIMANAINGRINNCRLVGVQEPSPREIAKAALAALEQKFNGTRKI